MCICMYKQVRDELMEIFIRKILKMNYQLWRTQTNAHSRRQVTKLEAT